MTDTRIPGPLPTIGFGRAPVVRIPSRVPAAATGLEPKAPEAASLELTRHLLEIGFLSLLIVSLPFIAYVVSWRGGFDLTSITYPLAAAAMGAGAIAAWMAAHGYAPAPLDVRRRHWALPLQVIPIAGFDLWRSATAAETAILVPLVALALAYVAATGRLGLPRRAITEN